MTDQIHIKKLVLPTVIGVPAAERALPQSVSVTASLHLAESLKGIDDELEQTVDYYRVSQEMRKTAAAKDRKLIETLAEDLAEVILSFDGVKSVRLEVEKYILPNCGAVSVEIYRSKNATS